MSRAVAAAAAAVIGVLGLAVPASAQADGRSSGTLRLASQTAWVGADQPFIMRLQVAGVPRPENVDLRVVVHSRVTSRSGFRLTMAGRSLGGTVETTSAKVADLLPTDAGGAFPVILGPPDLTLSRTGVYPVEVTLRESGVVLDRLITHLVFLADAPAAKLGVSWILPVSAAPALQPEGTRRLEDQGALGVLADELQSPAYRDVPLVLAPTPETVEALSAEPKNAGTLEGLRTAVRDRQLLARPYVPIDVAALNAAGLGEEVAAQRAKGTGVVSTVLGTRPDSRTWLATERLDDSSLALLRDQQVDRVVVAEQHLEPARLQVTLAQPFGLATRTSGRPVDALMADDALAAHFTNGGDQVLAAHQFLADLAVIWLDAPQRARAVVVATPRRWRPSRAFLDAALDGLARSPVLTGMTIDDVFSEIDPATSGRGAPLVRRLNGDRSTVGVAAAAVRRTRLRLDGFSSTLRPDSPLFDNLDSRLLLSESADLSSRRRAEYLAGVNGGIDAQLDQLVLPRSRTLTLTAREGEIPLTILNRSDVPMNAVVQLESDKLEFPGNDRASVELPPGSTTLRFQVRARTAGAFPLRVALRAPEGGLELDATRFTVRSTAASGVGIGLSVGAGLFLLAWWGRHLVRGRRARRLVPA